MKRHLFVLLLLANLLSGVIGFVSAFYVKSSSKIATVNVNAIVDHYVKTMADSTLEEALLEKNTEQFMKQLEIEIDKIAKEKKLTLFLSEAVLTPTMDLTEIIQKRTEQSYLKNELTGLQRGSLKNGLQ